MCLLTDGVLAMSAHLPKEQRQNVFHKVFETTTTRYVPRQQQRATVSEFVNMGVDPLCRDQYNLSCIDKAFLNANGNKMNTFLK